METEWRTGDRTARPPDNGIDYCQFPEPTQTPPRSVVVESESVELSVVVTVESDLLPLPAHPPPSKLARSGAAALVGASPQPARDTTTPRRNTADALRVMMPASM